MRRRSKIILSFISLAALTSLASCMASDVLNATIPRDGYVRHRDIAYGSHPRQRFDVYQPAGAVNAPVVVFFYGGSWKFGSKDDYRFLGQALASRGIVAVVADYQIYPEVKYPEFVSDSALAFTVAHTIVDQYGGDPARMFIGGHSAGAYNALMVAANPVFMQQAGGRMEWIRGVIGIAGPYNFLPFTDADIIDIFSTAEEADTQPITYITQRMAPVMLATGATDDTVDPRNSHSVAAKLTALNSPVVEHSYPDTGHIGIILSVAQGFRHRTPLLDDIERFVTTD